jgi:hypothetical protein
VGDIRVNFNNDVRITHMEAQPPMGTAMERHLVMQSSGLFAPAPWGAPRTPLGARRVAAAMKERTRLNIFSRRGGKTKVIDGSKNTKPHE